ncbi:MAG: hypothetical protein EOO36_08845, partial [Cytophagaceae bacterium]
MHILQVCYRVPYPPHDGGAIGVYEIIRGVSEAGHRVTVLAVNTPKHYQPATALDHLGPRVRLITVDVDTRLSPWKALRNLLGGRSYKSSLGLFGVLPYNVERFVSQPFAIRLAELLRAEQFDIVHFDGTFVALYARWLLSSGEARKLLSESVWAQLPPLVLRAHNVEYIIWQRLATREKNPLKRWYLGLLAERLQEFESWMQYAFEATAAITEEDARRLRALINNYAGTMAVIPAPANT